MVKLAKFNQVKLKWIPAHCGYDGNEKADCAAKEGVSRLKRNRNPVHVPVPKNKIKVATKSILDENASMAWEHKVNLRLSKLFIRKQDRNRTQELLNFPRYKTSLLTCALTGHGPVR